MKFFDGLRDTGSSLTSLGKPVSSAMTAAASLLRRSQNVSAAKTPQYHDLAIDLGTATGLVWSDGRFGQIKILDAMTKLPRDISHIRTLVAKRKVAAEKWQNNRERKERAKKEKGLALDTQVLDPDTFDKDVEAVGHAAFECWGRDPNLEVVQAVRGGNVGDVQAYRSVIRHLIRTRYPEFKTSFAEAFTPPRILIGVPRNATSRHLAFIQGVIKNDLKATPILVWEQVADAVGIRLKDGKPLDFQGYKSVAIADGGGGTFDFAILNNGRVVHQLSFDVAGDDLDSAIVLHLAREHNLDIGYRTAIAIKESIGSAIAIDGEDQYERHEVNGASFQTDMPGMSLVTRAEIRDCMKPVLSEIAANFRRYLATLQGYGEVHADIVENGFYLTGGTSQLKGLDKYLTAEAGITVMESEKSTEFMTGIEIHPVENPTTSVIDGLIRMLEDEKLLKLGLTA